MRSGRLRRPASGSGRSMRPWKTTRCESIVHSDFGKISATTASTFTGSSSVVQPNRRARRPKWVSTVIPGTPKALPRTTLAVLRPTPGRVTRSASRPGTSPSNSSRSAIERPIRDFALFRKNPVGRMISSSSAGFAAAMSSGEGYFANSAGCRPVHPQVGGLRRQHGGHQQLERVVEVQLRVRVRVQLRQLPVDPPRPPHHRQPRFGLARPACLPHRLPRRRGRPDLALCHA